MSRHVPKCACKRVKGDGPPGWVCVWGVVESAPLQNPEYGEGEFELRAYYGETAPGVYGYRIWGIEGWWTGPLDEDGPTVVPGAPSREKLRKTATDELSWAVDSHVEGGWEAYEEE